VPESQGSFAVGLHQLFLRFLGFIPAPTLFGRLIDESCGIKMNVLAIEPVVWNITMNNSGY